MEENIQLVKDTIERDDIDALIEWLKTYPRLTKGSLTLEYENNWSEWLGSKYSVFVNSGSSALLLMLQTIKTLYPLKNNKIVIPQLAWATDLSSAMILDFEPILCDINLENLSVSIQDLEKIFIEQEPSALMLVSALGLSPHMADITTLCKKYDVILLEDVCESQGTRYSCKKLGTFGLMSSFSTYFGHSMSVVSDTPIPFYDKKNQFRIENIKYIYDNFKPEEINILSFNQNDKKIYKRTPSEIIKHKLGDKRIFRLKLKNNRSVDITEDHSVFKFEMGLPVSVSGNKLKKGDKIIVPQKFNFNNEEINNLDFYSFCRKYNSTFFVINHNEEDYCNYKPKWGTKEYRLKENYKQRKQLPLELANNKTTNLRVAFKNTPKNKFVPHSVLITPSFCKMVGFFIAEGSFRGGKKETGLCFTFNKNEYQFIKEVLESIESVFGIIGYTSTSTKENVTQVMFDSKTLCFFFKYFLGIKSGAPNKRIPDFIWNVNTQNKLNFLHGFHLGDGTCDETRTEFASSSKMLINDVSYLCSSLGIRGSTGVKCKIKESYIKGRLISPNFEIESYRMYNTFFNEEGELYQKKEGRKTSLVYEGEDYGDLMELEIRDIEILNSDDHEFVYDFSVPNYENFVGGWQPICLHNSTIEGGMVCTDDKEVYDTLLQLRSHGWDRDLDNEAKSELREKWSIDEFNALYTFYIPAFNLRSTDLQAFLGIRQLEKIDDWLAKRNTNFSHLKNEIEELKLWTPTPTKGSWTASFCYPIILENKTQKERVILALHKNNIECRPLISGSMGMQPMYVSVYGEKSTDNSKKIDECGIYIPNHPKLSVKEITFMVDVIKKAL